MNILDKLTRKTNSKNFIPEIDGFRFLAIMPVCLMHFNTWFSRSLSRDYKCSANILNSWDFFFTRGELGVNIFFAVSGFILGFPFIKAYIENKKTPKLSQYYMRRVTRLEPPYIITLVLLLLVHIFIYREYLIKELVSSFLASLFYSHYFIFDKWSIINPVTWSLETEIQFYLLAPFLCCFFFKFCRKRIQSIISIITTILIFVFIGWIVTTNPALSHFGKSILIYLPHFLIGFLIAIIYIKKYDFLTKKNVLFDIIGIISFYGLFLSLKTSKVIFLLALFMLFLSVFKGTTLNKFFKIKIVYVIGGMCYTIYLLHYSLFYLVGKYSASLVISSNYQINYLLQIAVVFPIVFFVCSIFFILIEKPCMNKNWPHELWRKIKSIKIHR
jgi:peptidoglycan/LPS O-acetylase OafA/YrhL